MEGAASASGKSTSKYVFKAESRDSAPLYVCAPVQITVETGSKASAGVGLGTGLKGGVDRSRTFSMQVSAPVDPTLAFEVITPDEKDPYRLYDAVYRYAADLSEGHPFKDKEIVEYIFKRYEEYMSPEGGRVRVSDIKPITVDEGQSITIPLEFTPLRAGRTAVVISAMDEQGEQVFSDFIDLNCDVETQTITREF
jgi:hypothetical protein